VARKQEKTDRSQQLKEDDIKKLAEFFKILIEIESETKTD